MVTIGAMRWLLLPFVAFSFTASHGKDRHSGRGMFSQLEADLNSAGKYFINIFEGTSNATEPDQLVTYHPGHDYPPAELTPATHLYSRYNYTVTPSAPDLYGGYNHTVTPEPHFYGGYHYTVPAHSPAATPAPSLNERMHSLVGEAFGLPLNILRKFFSMFWFLTKLPTKIVGKINALCDGYLPRKFRETISYYQLKFLAILVRIAVFNLKVVLRLVRWVYGDFCIVFPNIPALLNLFLLKGGKICPFQWLYLDDVMIENSKDDEYWDVTFPFNFMDVQILFARAEMSVLGLFHPGIGGFNLTANDVAVNFTLRFTKDVFPMILPLKSIEDTTIQVEGCTGNQPDFSWLSNKLMEFAFKLCDPVLNEILRVVMFTGRINVELTRWFFNKFIKGAQWVENMVSGMVEKIVNGV